MKRARRLGPLGTIRAYLELVRLPNLFTAMADVLAGYLTVTAPNAGSGQAVFDGEQLAWLIVSTVCLYGGGITLNDYFDEPVDRVERPERPLPSGRVSRAAARRFAIALFVLAGLAAASVGPFSLALALAIALSAGLYDAVGKRMQPRAAEHGALSISEPAARCQRGPSVAAGAARSGPAADGPRDGRHGDEPGRSVWRRAAGGGPDARRVGTAAAG